MLLKGKTVSLRPMKKDEIPLFYKWATHSDATSFWYEELYGNEIPTFEKFLESWKPHYFNDDNPELGRCFVILLKDEPIGQINYNPIDPKERRVEIDILIADSKHQGKGYGSDAIKTLVSYMLKELKVKEVWVAAIKKNPRAINAYQKAGFRITKPPEGIENDPYWAKKNLEDYVFLSHGNGITRI
jgi:RimJ/RimL family protein N-acetyltransferase